MLAGFVPNTLPGFLQEILLNYFQTSCRELLKRFSVFRPFFISVFILMLLLEFLLELLLGFFSRFLEFPSGIPSAISAGEAERVLPRICF